MSSTTTGAVHARVPDSSPQSTADDDRSSPGPGPETERSFLPLPPPLEGRARRTHQIVLVCLMLFGLAQGAYWIFATTTWNPIDEVAHFGYVESLATGQGIPTVGVDLLDDETLASFKATPTLLFRSNPYKPTSSDPNWGGTREQYEAIQGPTYYAAMVPAYWIGRPFGVTASLYAIRFATVALVLAAVPLTWLLARRLFPDRPVVWLLSPALLIAVNSLSPGTVSNDAMMLVLSIATVIVFLRALDQPRRLAPSLGAGALFGLTIVTKMTSLGLIPFLALAFLAWVVVMRPRLLAMARFVGLFLVGAVVTFGPWLAFNLRTYQAPSGAGVVEGITGSVLPESELGLSAINQHLTVARPGLWLGQLLVSPPYQTLWEVALVVALVLGGAAAIARKRWRDLAVLLWCGSALPLAFIAMEVIVFGLFGGTGGPMGRHLIAGLAPTMVMVAAATVLVVGSRWAPPVIASLIAASLAFQVSAARTFISSSYLTVSIDHRYAPTLYQDWSDAVANDRSAIAVDASCPVELVGVGFLDLTPEIAGSLPATVTVNGPSGTVEAVTIGTVNAIPTYRLPAPVSGPFTIELPEGHILRTTLEDLDGDVSFTNGAAGDPVAAAYCADPEADERSFAQLYPIGHPDRISLGMLEAGPVLLAAAGVLVAIGLAINAARRSWGGGAPPSSPPPAPAA